MTSLKTLNYKDAESGHEILIKTINIEFEVRSSHLIDFYSDDLLGSCVCEVKFDEENIKDLTESGEIEDNATLLVEVVSKDKKCSKTKIKEREISEYVPKKIPQRLFMVDDTIQIQINNPYNDNHVVLLKPIDLPLMLGEKKYVHWAQMGPTSQLKLTVGLRQSEKLKKEVEANRTVNLKSIPEDAKEGEPTLFKLEALGVDVVIEYGTEMEAAEKKIT